MEKLTAFTSLLLIVALSLTAPAAFAEGKQKVVNINEAAASQLALLPRVGPSLSARIVEFRDENGKFKQVGDLMLVRGIGEKTFALMEPYLAVSGETTLTEKVRASEVQSRTEASADASRE